MIFLIKTPDNKKVKEKKEKPQKQKISNQMKKVDLALRP
jgi:hypothetical protein